MRICVSTVCWRHRPLEEALDQAAQAGFEAVEAVLFPREIGRMHGDLRELRPPELMRLLSARGLRLAAIHIGALATTTPELTRALMDYTRLTLDAAAETGCNLVVTGGPLRGRDRFMPFIRALEELLPHLERTPAHLALENHFHFWLQSPADYEHLFDALTHPQIGITLDTGHFSSAGVDPAAVAEQFGGRVFHVHIKDRIGPKAVPFGTGETNNFGTVRALARLGYDGWLSQELEMGHDPADEAAAAEGIAYMRALLAAGEEG